MRIIQVIDTVGPGGAEDVLVEFATACVAASHECEVLAPGPGWLTEALMRRNIPVQVANPTGAFSLGFLTAIVGAVRRHRAEVIHAHLFGAGLYGALAGVITRVPVVITLHGIVDLPPTERLMWLKTRILRSVHRIVAVSDPLRAFLLERLDVPPALVETVPNGIDTVRFRTAAPLDLRGQHGLQPSAVVLGSVGNIRPAKAYEVGLQALGELRKRGMDAHWFIAGQADPEGTLMSSLEAEAARLGVRSAVHFLGFLSEAERFLAALDGYLLCSRSEGHPLSLCQAMAAGKPIVATACGVEHFIRDGSEGWIVPVGDAAAIAETVRQLVGSPAEATGRAARAQSRALAEYDARTSFDRYFALYAAAAR